MKHSRIIAIALRILDRLLPASFGRPNAKLAAAAARTGRAIRTTAAPFIFSAAWTMLYPAWRTLARGWLPHAVPSQWLALSWPLPSLLEMACGMVPAVVFIWLGFLAYIFFRRDILDDLSPLRLIASLSASLNVLLASTLALLQHFGHQMLSITREDFYSAWHLYTVSLPLACGVFLAVWMVMPRKSQPPRVRRRSPARLPQNWLFNRRQTVPNARVA